MWRKVFFSFICEDTYTLSTFVTLLYFSLSLVSFSVITLSFSISSLPLSLLPPPPPLSFPLLSLPYYSLLSFFGLSLCLIAPASCQISTSLPPPQPRKPPTWSIAAYFSPPQIPGCSPGTRSEVNGEVQASDTDCMSRLDRRCESGGGPRGTGHGCGHEGSTGPRASARQPAGTRDSDGTPLIRLLVLGGHGVGKSGGHAAFTLSFSE